MRLGKFVGEEKAAAHDRIENICGVLVHVKPDLRTQVRDTFHDMPGVEVHALTDDGRMVVTVEDAPGRWAGATMSSFNDIQGVLSVALVYHHFDSDLEGETVS